LDGRGSVDESGFMLFCLSRERRQQA